MSARADGRRDLHLVVGAETLERLDEVRDRLGLTRSAAVELAIEKLDPDTVGDIKIVNGQLKSRQPH